MMLALPESDNTDKVLRKYDRRALFSVEYAAVISATVHRCRFWLLQPQAVAQLLPWMDPTTNGVLFIEYRWRMHPFFTQRLGTKAIGIRNNW